MHGEFDEFFLDVWRSFEFPFVLTTVVLVWLVSVKPVY